MNKIAAAVTLMTNSLYGKQKGKSDSEIVDSKEASPLKPVVLFGIQPDMAQAKHGIEEDGLWNFDFVILGGGTSAFHAAEEFVKSGNLKNYSVALISRESHVPCYPKTMVQNIAAGASLESSLLQTERWFSDHGVTLSLQTNVTFFDARKRTLVADRCDRVTRQTTHFRFRANHAIILATGARPSQGPPLLVLDDKPLGPMRNPNCSYPGVEGLFTLRTYAGGLTINSYLDRAKNVVVIGGGFLGLDMAYMARNRGLNVTLVCSSACVLRRVFTEEMAQMYQDFFERNGVKMCMGSGCKNILVREGKVVGVRLRDQSELECDMVMAACGVVPNIDLFRGQLQLEKNTSTPGVLVDAYLLTSVPGVYAIGDVCAMRFAQHNPGAIRHLSNAALSGARVAQALISAADSISSTPKRRGSKLGLSARRCTSGRSTVQERMMQALVPGCDAIPYAPHPAYDVNHFDLRGYVSGDRLGPDFVMVGTDMGPDGKLVTFWLWENRVVGAFVSNPSFEEKALLDEATKEQWLIENMPELRVLRNAYEALDHIKKHHRL